MKGGDKMSLARKIIEKEMEKEGVTQVSLANRLGLCHATIYKILHTDTKPTVATLQKIAKGFNVSLSKLMGEVHGDETEPGIVYGNEIDRSLKKIVKSGDDKILKLLRDQLDILASMTDTKRNKPSNNNYKS